MSINDAMLSGVTGLIANSAALSAISDNIANSQTVGYKTTNVDFSTLVTGQSFGGDISAGGVTAVAAQDVVQQGQMQASTSPTDLGIQGDGFFVTTQNAASPTSTSPVLLTRAGSFTQNSQGFLVNSAGLYLQGWPVDSTGQVQTNPTNMQDLQPINITAIAGAAEPTTDITINANLSASQAISAAAQAAGQAPPGAGAYDPVANSMAAGGVTPDTTIPLNLSDSKGTDQSFTLDLLKSSVPNQWYAEIVASPPSTVTTGPGTPPGQVAAGIIAFTPTGQYDAATTAALNPGTIFAQNPPSLSIGASNDPTAGTVAGQVNWGSSLGDAAQSVNLNLANSLTQFDSGNQVNNIQANGTTFGNLQSVTVTPSGEVFANFDNSVSRQIAQIALATVPNPDGMSAQAGNAYTVTSQSGTATLKTPGAGGAGQIEAGELEASTVDLSTEFTDLIQTQQAYSASSKIITTANQMLSTLENIIQA